MTESDDDYDRNSNRRRGKFRKERDDSYGYNNNNNYSNNGGMEINSSKRRDYERPMKSNSFKQNGDSYSYRRTPSPKRGFSPSRDRSDNRYQNPQQPSYYSNNRSPPRMQYSREHHRREDLPPGSFKRQNSHYGNQFNPMFNSQQMRPRSPPPFGNQYSNEAYYSQDEPHKKFRREWSPPINDMLDNNYFEHDNRLAPEGGHMNDFIPGRSANPRTYNPSFRYDLQQQPIYNPGPGLYNQQSNLYSQQFLQNRPYISNNLNNGFGNNMMNSNNNQLGLMGNNNNFQQPQQHYMNNSNTCMFNDFNGPVFNDMMGRNFTGNNMNNNNLKFNNSNMNFNNNNYHNNSNNNNMNNMNNNNFETQPQMLSFKQFLSNLNNNETNGTTLSPEISTKRYNEYKNEFRADQIAKFFAGHKNDEWFRQRYHPVVSAKRKDEQREAILRRLKIFKYLMNRFNASGNELTLDMSNKDAEKKLAKFLDACMIKLEGGTDEDLKILERIYDKEEIHLEQSVSGDIKHENVVIAAIDKQFNEEKGDEENEDDESGVDSNSSESEADNGEIDSKFDRKKKRNKLKLVARNESQAEEKKHEEAAKLVEVSEIKEDQATKTDQIEKKDKKSNEELPIPQKTQSIFFKHLPVNITRQDLEEIGSKFDGFKRASISEPAPERRFQRRGWLTFTSQINIKDTCAKINGTKCKDFILNASINRELDQKVKCIIGLTNHKQIIRNDLRLLAKIAENMDRRWGLWQYQNFYSNNILNDEDFKTDSENRKSKTTKNQEKDGQESKEFADNQYVSEEIDLKVKIESDAAVEANPSENNPWIEIANAYLKELVHEQDGANLKAEDGKAVEENLKASNGSSNNIKNIKLEKDERASVYLDNMILYLRIVHSIDFYNATEYQQEDWMPNRCGVLHVRGSSEQKSNAFVSVLTGVNINFFDPETIKKSQIEEWNRLFEASVKTFYEYKERIDDEISKRLGVKDLKEEIDKFIAVNTKQVDKEIWLCVLSGKKFKSPEYVKKHLETKHREKLVEIRNDIEYFNRFVYDPKRPYLPEHPLTKMMGHHTNGNGGSYQGNNFGGNFSEFNNGNGQQGSFCMSGGGIGQNAGLRPNHGQRRY